MHTSLNEDEQVALKKILSSDLFKKAMEVVLEKNNGPIYHLAAPEQLTALAQEKGIRNAFRELDMITYPKRPSQQVRLSGSIHNSPKTST